MSAPHPVNKFLTEVCDECFVCESELVHLITYLPESFRQYVEAAILEQVDRFLDVLDVVLDPEAGFSGGTGSAEECLAVCHVCFLQRLTPFQLHQDHFVPSHDGLGQRVRVTHKAESFEREFKAEFLQKIFQFMTLGVLTRHENLAFHS